MKEPDATPLYVWMTCSWQLVGGSQWNSETFQDSADAGSVPCSASAADPENEIVSPTFQVVAAVGPVIVGVGAVFDAPTWIDTLAVDEAPLESITLSRAV